MDATSIARMSQGKHEGHHLCQTISVSQRHHGLRARGRGRFGPDLHFAERQKAPRALQKHADILCAPTAQHNHVCTRHQGLSSAAAHTPWSLLLNGCRGLCVRILIREPRRGVAEDDLEAFESVPAAVAAVEYVDVMDVMLRSQIHCPPGRIGAEKAIVRACMRARAFLKYAREATIDSS